MRRQQVSERLGHVVEGDRRDLRQARDDVVEDAHHLRHPARQTLVGMPLNHGRDQGRELRVDVASELRHQRLAVEEQVCDHLLGAERPVERPPFDQLVEDQAEREQIRPLIDRRALAVALVPELLRRAVPIGAHERPELRAIAPVADLDEAEVGEERMGDDAAPEQDVARLDVAMDHPGAQGAGRVDVRLGVRIGERARDLPPDREPLGERGPIALAEPLREVRAVDVLHLEVVLIAVAAQVEDLHDVRVPQPGQRAPLAQDPHHRVARALPRIHLDLQGADLLQEQVANPVDGALAPAADPLENLVLPRDGRRHPPSRGRIYHRSGVVVDRRAGRPRRPSRLSSRAGARPWPSRPST